MYVDVIIRTYNPRVDYLARVLESIRAQVFGGLSPEITVTVVDNNSPEPVAGQIVELTSQFGVILAHEKTQGSIHAYIRGIIETKADLQIWVDDDTVLEPNYIQEAIRVYETRPFLGVWGGNIHLELEKPVPDDIRPHLSLLTEVHVDREEWSNYRNCHSVAGAGMCVKRCVAEQYLKTFNATPLLTMTGRTDKNLFSGEDWVFCLSAADLGLGVGRIPALALTHLIPERRTTEDYLLKVAEGHSFSLQVVHAVRGISMVDYQLKRQLWELRFRNFFKSSFSKRIQLARLSGLINGNAFVKSQRI